MHQRLQAHAAVAMSSISLLQHRANQLAAAPNQASGSCCGSEALSRPTRACHDAKLRKMNMQEPDMRRTNSKGYRSQAAARQNAWRTTVDHCSNLQRVHVADPVVCTLACPRPAAAVPLPRPPRASIRISCFQALTPPYRCRSSSRGAAAEAAAAAEGTSAAVAEAATRGRLCAAAAAAASFGAARLSATAAAAVPTR